MESAPSRRRLVASIFRHDSILRTPTGYLRRHPDKPFAWLIVFALFGLTGGALAGFSQGRFEAALLCGFVGIVVGSIAGMFTGVVVWLCRRLMGLPLRR